jgi:hypothetical protein
VAEQQQQQQQLAAAQVEQQQQLTTAGLRGSGGVGTFLCLLLLASLCSAGTGTSRHWQVRLFYVSF